MERVEQKRLGLEEERLVWEGLVSSCAEPLRRLGAFGIVGLVVFFASTSGVVLYYSVFGVRAIPYYVFYATIVFGVLVALGGWGVWIARSLRSYNSFRTVLERSGLDSQRPTRDGLGVYSDDQILALRSRYDSLRRPKVRELFERTFGFTADDSFHSGPLNARPGTFELDALRVEWESNLILATDTPRPKIGWWRESRLELLPRNPDDINRLVFALRYTRDSVRTLKLRYGIRVGRWHQTVPEGQLWDAMRDYEDSQRLQLDLRRKAVRP